VDSPTQAQDSPRSTFGARLAAMFHRDTDADASVSR